MANAISLDDIRAAAERKYGSTDISLADGEVVRLLNPLRLTKARRDELSKLQDKLGEDGADQAALLSEAIRLVAENDTLARKLLKVVGEDLAVLAQIFEAYSAGTRVGEASPSAA